MSEVKADKLIKEAEEVTGEVIKRLEEDKNVMGIILFGSYIHGKTTQPSDVDLDVLTRVREKKSETVIRSNKKININYLYMSSSDPREDIIRLLITHLLPEYEDFKTILIVSKILFDRTGEITEYYNAMRRLWPEEIIYLLSFHLQRAKHYSVINKYYKRDNLTTRLNYYLCLKELLFTAYILNNKVKLTYEPYNVQKLQLPKGFKEFINKTKRDTNPDWKSLKYFLEEFLKVGLKRITDKIKKLGLDKELLVDINPKGDSGEEIDKLFYNIQEEYVELMEEGRSLDLTSSLGSLYDKLKRLEKERDKFNYLIEKLS